MESEKIGERLKIAFNYLKNKGKVKYQRDIASKMQVNEVTVSRAFSGVDRYCNKQFLLNFNGSFDNVFSLKWLMGEDVPMLSTAYDEQTQSDPSTPVESLINLAASLIQETEQLRRQLVREIEDIQNLKAELRATITLLSTQPTSTPTAYPSYLAEGKNV